jgi:hypothetical protein
LPVPFCVNCPPISSFTDQRAVVHRYVMTTGISRCRAGWLNFSVASDPFTVMLNRQHPLTEKWFRVLGAGNRRRQQSGGQ